MKYLSEDGKVFMYEEECLAHEKSVRENEQKKAEREEKRKAKETLDKQFEYLVENIDLWLKNSIEFQNKYGKDEDEIKNAKDVDKFLDFLMDCFE